MNSRYWAGHVNLLSNGNFSTSKVNAYEWNSCKKYIIFFNVYAFTNKKASRVIILHYRNLDDG